MKKLFFSVGLCFILVGVVLSLNYNSSKVMRKIEVVNKDYDVWNITAYLEAGDKIRVICYPGRNWDEELSFDPGDDYVPVPHRHIWFEIVDPNGKITEYNTAWTTYGPGGEKVTFSRCYVNVTIRDGIEVEQYPTYIGGTVKLNGTYTVRIGNEVSPPIDFFDPPPFKDPYPPTYLAIEKEYPITVYPYTYLLPVGVSVSIMGVVISTWAARRPKLKKRRFTKKF